ncbi:MAG: response regulator transcription factor [Actinomycetota bacterium]|nr:response regulator transcription factor [Actinomycetota bacterium]
MLIVDDQAPFRDVARMVVDMADGFEVVGEAKDGLTAVSAASALRPALVLMDLNMPDINGFEATRRIRAELPETRVLMLSTHDPADYRPQALEAGAFDFMAKSSFDPMVLEDAWTDAMSES